MEYKTQKYLRIFSVTVLILVLIDAVMSPIKICNCSNLQAYLGNWTTPTLNFLLGVIPAYLYCEYIQRPIMEKLLFEETNKNIITTLLTVSKLNISQEKMEGAKKYLFHLFFNLIDNDTSLSLKAQNIRINGYFVSLTFDVICFVFLNLIIQVLLIHNKFNTYRINILEYSSYLLIFFPIFLKLLLNIHFDLSKKQLKIIELRKAGEVEKGLNDWVNNN